jgi:peptidoglycan/LPS O-acetylase OafA/YrhL
MCVQNPNPDAALVADCEIQKRMDTAELKCVVKRIPELDSLRGLAALSVVFLHFQDMFFPNDHNLRMTHKELVTLRLLSPFSQGYEAVMLFFALSGFVLSQAYLARREQPYGLFVSRRITRIYVPYFVSLTLAVAGDAIWHGHLGLGNWAEGMWSQPVDVKLVMQHILLLGNYNWGQINAVIWSLVYEMRISLIFPLLFLMVERLGTGWSLVVAAFLPVLARVLDIVFAGHDKTTATLTYAAIFVCGIVLAKNREAIVAWYRRRNATQQASFVMVVRFHRRI